MLKLGNKVIDQNSSTYIIAEVGVNHNGSVALAKEMIDAAVDAGADAVKFQTFKSEKLVSKKAKKAKYQMDNTDEANDTQFEMLKKLELTLDDFITLKNYCEEKGIEFISTPFDDDSAAFLNEIGVHAFKIGSGDLTNLPFLKLIDSFKLPIILSTGMANLGEIEEALNCIQESPVVLLHCTSNYPAPYEDVNLKSLLTMKQAFGRIMGYSDHTEGNEIAVAAVTLGAKMIEKHFTLDRNLPGPDHKASMEPSELKHLVNVIRNVELSLGDGIKRCMPSEMNTKEVARKSIVATSKIEKGGILTKDNIGIKRPGNGIAPKFYDQLLGKTLKNGIEEDEMIRWGDLLK